MYNLKIFSNFYNNKTLVRYLLNFVNYIIVCGKWRNIFVKSFLICRCGKIVKILVISVLYYNKTNK